MATLGPEPLLRHRRDGRLQVQAAGIELLRRAGAPVHVAFAIGGSRCGKSTASNALIFGAEPKVSGFETGSSFDPVTTGVDVAAQLLPGGGALIVGDCEGAFHICGSAQSARGFGSLGILAYHLSSTLIHVSMGGVDERDIEVLGYLAASAAGGSGADGSDADEALKELALPAPQAKPSLVLLVNGARFDLGDAVARRLLRPPDGAEADGARRSSRVAISQGFRGQPALEALPACEHAAYWPKVDGLRSRLLEAVPVTLPSGLQASGNDLADRITSLIATLNGEAAETVRLREPPPATDDLYRSAHLEPIIEEISRKFAAGVVDEPNQKPQSNSVAQLSQQVLAAAASDTGTPPLSPAKRAMEEALLEFDRRTAWLVGNQSTNGRNAPGADGAPVHEQLVADMRGRLLARLVGINEARARGRQQGLSRRPRLQRRPSLGSLSAGDICGSEKENRTPSYQSKATTPSGIFSTPSGSPRRRTLQILEAQIADLDKQLETSRTRVTEEVLHLRKAFDKAKQNFASFAEETAELQRQAATTATSLQERWHERLQNISGDRISAASAQAVRSNAAFAELQEDLRAVGAKLPDVGRCAGRLNELRGGIQAEHARRQETIDAASRALEGHVHELREAVAEESVCLEALRETFACRMTREMKELRSCIEEEKAQRQERHKALAQVVDGFRVSLESSASIHKS